MTGDPDRTIVISGDTSVTKAVTRNCGVAKRKP